MPDLPKVELCMADIEAAISSKKGGDYKLTANNKKELRKLVEDTWSRVASDPSVDDVAGGVADSLIKQAERMKAAKEIAKHNTYMNAIKKAEMIDYLATHHSGNPMRGLDSILAGIESARAGSRRSVVSVQESLKGEYIGGFLKDVDEKNLMPILTGADEYLDDQIAEALWRIDDPGRTMDDLTDEAVQVAEIIHKWQEVTRKDANLFGAWIGRRKGYIFKQSHDTWKMSGLGKKEEWAASIHDKLDWAKIADEMNMDLSTRELRDSFLAESYDGIMYGTFFRHQSKSMPGTGAGFKNVAKSMSQERILQFKDSKSFMEYNREWGKGNIRESVMSGLMGSAHQTGMLQVLGPNAMQNFQDVASFIGKNSGDEKVKGQINNALRENGFLMKRFKHVDGTANVAQHAMGAKVSAIARALQSMSKLGGAVISAFSDLPAIGMEYKYQGGSFFDGMAKSVSGLMQGIGGNSADRVEVARMLGIFFDSAVGDIGARFSGHDDLGGFTSRSMQFFFKANGLAWWTDTLRISTALAFSNNLAVKAGMSFDQLGDDLTRSLGLYGIDSGKWDIIRSTAFKEINGEQYLVPEAIADIDDKVFADYLENVAELKATDKNIAMLKRQLEVDFRTYFTDRATHAVIDTDAKTQSYLLQGTQPGTPVGEFLRFVAQFKQFPFAVLQKAVGRELYGRGFEFDPGAGLMANTAKLMKEGRGEMLGIINMINSMALFGYGSMVAKEYLKGREPRPIPTDSGEFAELWTAAMLQGGGLGIFGDLLFGEAKNRYGGNFFTSLAGPTVGTANQLWDLKGRATNGDDVGAATAKVFVDNTPFFNHFAVRPVLNYLLLYSAQEAMNPGYLSRMESRLQKDMNQELLSGTPILAPDERLRPFE